MGRIIEYVVLLSNLSLALGVVQYAKTSPDYGKGGGDKHGNFTQPANQYFPQRDSNFFGRKILPPEMHNRRRTIQSPKQMPTSLGLHAYASDDDSDRNRKPRRQPRRNLPPFSQGLYPRRNSKTFYSADITGQKLSKLSDHNHSGNHHRPNDFNRRYQKEARRYHSPKICDPCNSVPWVPLLKVSDSYRQQRTHELHPAPQQNNFNFDYHAYASDAHNILLPPVPLSPPVFDSTISSSFGLPIGNIPTSHGLLAPLHHLASDFSKYSIDSIDYSSAFNYYTPHGLLETNSFPELSPVPVVPIHDSGQFHQFDSSVPDLVPPPSKDISKVVLTISEEHRKNPQGKEQNRSKDLGTLEIVKSIPLAEFTSSVKVPQEQELPLYPPLQGEFSTEQKKHSDRTSGFLVPPPVSFGSNKTTESSEYVGQATAPKPLTSPSLSWLFSDHTAPPKTTVSLPATDAQEIASVVNNELLPASPHPLEAAPGEQNTPKSSKKIQIIIPYTTKGKTDNSAVESVQHEVFQPPRESATSVLPPRSTTTQRPRQSEKTAGYITEMQHIIASNLRELLREEIDKKDQNYPLQNNIDNWTALEYSNHKTAASKAPKEIIAQALAVTSIPGTSISHLLLPSKKIPKEYFVTTPLPVYDEPSTLVYKTVNTSVNSRPFTAKPYATTNVYNPRGGNVKQQPPNSSSNHEGNYTEVERGKVNIWGKLNENLVLPEARSRTTAAVVWPSSVSSISSEKIEIVTPVSVGERNRTTGSFRRTTRHVRTTEAPTADKFRVFLNNSTKLEKVTNLTSPLRGSSGNSSSGSNDNNNSSSSNNNSSSSSSNNNSSSGSNGSSSNGSSSSGSGSNTSGSSTSGSSSPEEESVAGKGEHVSINDIFPFRNKELPWESGRNSSQSASRMGRQRKSLIKQVKTQKTRAAVGSS